MNLTAAQRTRLGAFLAAGAVLVVGTIGWLVGSSLWAEVDRYSVSFRESVSGLEVASVVKYQGLRIGRVAGLRIDEDDPAAIIVDLALDPGTVLHKGTEARLDQSALTGLTTINLSPGDLRAGRITPGSRLLSGLSFTAQITGKAESIRIKLEALSNQALRWTSDPNRKRVEHLIDDTGELTRELTATIRALRPRLVAAVEQVELAGRGAVRLSHATTRTLRVARDTTRDIRGRTKPVFDEVDRILKGIQPAQLTAALGAAQGAMKRLEARLSAAEVDRAMTGLQGALVAMKAAVASISKLLASVELSLRAVRGDTLATIRHLRDASNDLRTFSRDIARDPALLLRGRGKAR